MAVSGEGERGAGATIDALQGKDNFVATGGEGATLAGAGGPGEQRVHTDPHAVNSGTYKQAGQSVKHDITSHRELHKIYSQVVAEGGHNYRGARVPVPSGLCIDAWRSYLQDYSDHNLVDFLAYGWPINCTMEAMLQPTFHNHPSAQQFMQDIYFYIDTEMGFGALGGPYASQPFTYMQLSPLMTKPKKDSAHRRVIMDLSWPPMASVNDAIRGDWYVDGLMAIRLPTMDYMESRLLQLGRALIYIRPTWPGGTDSYE